MPSTPAPERLAVIGGGNIGEALLTGLLLGDKPVFAAGDISVVEHDPSRAVHLHDTLGVTVADLAAAVSACGTVVIAVKPYHVDAVLAAMAEYTTDEHLIISMAGGIPIERIEAGLGVRAAVVRCMPNTPVAVAAGAIAMSTGTYADSGRVGRAWSMLESVGTVVEVPQHQLDAVTALSGSGPAYLFLLAEAMIDAGVLLGLARPAAKTLVTATMAGAGRLLRESGQEAAVLRAAVCSPGGTTVAALRELENHGFRAAMLAAADAGRNRTVELSREGAHR